MCGIAGEVRFDDRSVEASSLQTMLSRLERRGPDGVGSFVQGNRGFGQRRLKIIDLSEHSQQPMIDNALGLGIVYNGAIYNYKELRDELKEKGYRFFSSGDTEVLLKAYHCWGRSFVEHLNGMFALAIWERDSGKVLLARDRLGIKPLYFSKTAKRFLFASNLQAVLSAGEVNTDINPTALHHFLSFHSVVPPPHTILKGIQKLPPATVLEIHPDGEMKEHTYWELDFSRSKEEESRTLKEWKELVFEELIASVRRRLVADVPVGILLSGGLDSSLITGLLAKETGQAFETFSIGFDSTDEEKGDEFQYSDIVAEAFGTKHHQIRVPASRVFESLESCFRSMSEPMMSHDVIGFYLLSQEVSKTMKVVQSGQGADEVFAGYHWYPNFLDSQNAVDDYRKAFFDRSHEEMSNVLESSLLTGDHSFEYVKERFGKHSDWSAVDQVLGIDTTVMLVDDPVKRVDNMTMAWGLEARVPFLDHELVELAAKVPARFKVEEGGKYVLKEIGRDVLPHAVIDRPKGYFPVPALKYLRGPYLDFVKSVFDQKAAQERGIVKKEYLSMLMENPEKHITALRGSKLWQLTTLEYWLQLHGI